MGSGRARLPVFGQTHGSPHMLTRSAPPQTNAIDCLAVSPAEAARMAGIGRTKLYQALSSGDLASFKMGSRRLIRVTVLDAWLAEHEGQDQSAN